jgi:kinesin family protein 2/24
MESFLALAAAGGELDSDSTADLMSRTVEGLFDEEEGLLNSHMGVIQENAELLTEEGRLLQQIQGADVQVQYSIAQYSTAQHSIAQYSTA